MYRVLAARAAEFLGLHAIGVLFLVLRGGVIPVFALTTLQRNDFPHFLNSFSLECGPA
jgi:non-ribosomal peptide synthetase component E (peptide arylation enzyme)